jgi:hypothetical protein
VEDILEFVNSVVWPGIELDSIELVEVGSKILVFLFFFFRPNVLLQSLSFNELVIVL